MSNANRDYVIVYDVKNSSLVLGRPLIFYITDKNTSNIFVKLVTKVIAGNGIDQYTDIENASSYVLTMRVIKPSNEVNSIEATQHEEASIFQFDLTEDFKDIPGKYICELTISNIVSGRQELITSDPFNYEVKRSILSNISEIIETEDTTVEKLLNNLEASKVRLFNDLELAKTNLHNDLNTTSSTLNSQIQASNNKIENIKEELSSQLGTTKTELSSQINGIVNVGDLGKDGDNVYIKDSNGNKIGNGIAISTEVNNINDTTVSATTTYSSSKIEMMDSQIRTSIPTKTSQLDNDSSYVTKTYVDNKIPQSGSSPSISDGYAIFTSVNELQNADVSVGDKCILNGYYVENDSEKHYRIIASSNDGSGVQLANGLYANILHNGYLKAEWFGAISSSSTDYRGNEFQKFLDYIKTGKGTVFDIGTKNIYINTPTTLIFTKSGGNFMLKSSGGRLMYSLTTKEPCLKLGLQSDSYCSLSRVYLRDIKITANGAQTSALQLFTEGNKTLAFWNSKFINIDITCNRGKGLFIMNGLFESVFDGIRIDMRRKGAATSSDPITTNDIGLYLGHTDNNNIMSSLDFRFVNIWGGYHCIKTDSTANTHAPGFSCRECHVFDSVAEALYLDNQLEGNYIDKLHIEFPGTAENPCYGAYWKGYGVINSIDGGGDYLLGYVNTYCYNLKPLKVYNVAQPYRMPLKEAYIKYNGDQNGILETDIDFTNISLYNYAKGKIICMHNGRSLEIEVNGNSKQVSLKAEEQYAYVISSNQGSDNRVAFTSYGKGAIQGGLTDLTTLDLTATSTVMSWDSNNGSQGGVKLGFYDKTPISKPAVTGSVSGNSALQSLITQLANLGLISDNTN